VETRCDECNEILRVGDWPFCPHGPVRGVLHSIHPRERCVVWKHPATGDIVYPGRNDVPMPSRYVAQGYERHELGSIRAIHKHEQEQGVHSEISHFDAGTGRGFDDQDAPGLPQETMELLRSGAIQVRSYNGKA
jgi:hypothetical protein